MMSMSVGTEMEDVTIFAITHEGATTAPAEMDLTSVPMDTSVSGRAVNLHLSGTT